jgi:hypothetical protein
MKSLQIIETENSTFPANDPKFIKNAEPSGGGINSGN